MSDPSQSERINYKPIGYVHCDRSYRSEAPRQGVFANNSGTIELLPGHNFETALRDLNSFDRIWIIFDFHLNKNWKPVVSPPIIGDRSKIGVFATRSPHRPCSIGMTCARLVSIDKLTLHICDFDILDGSPVLDIKPYIPDSDSFPDASRGWLPEQHKSYQVEIEPEVEQRMTWLLENGGPDLKNFSLTQLSNEPFNIKRKRVKQITTNQGTIHCRTWKMDFILKPDSDVVLVKAVESNYTAEELVPESPDPYNDKSLHRQFLLL
tara:strand:+ start:141 stop:935 length:795 start_codon:yes stop_codon:yes gene_type:complete